MKKAVKTYVIIFLLCVSTTYAFEESDLIIHGFASTGYMKSNHTNFLLSSKEGGFEFNEFGINFNTKIAENIRIGAQLYSFNLGDIGNNEIILDWAFLDCSWKEEIGIRLGKMKNPFGLYNDVRDYDMLRTCILLPQSVYNNYLRQAMIGLEGTDIYGKISMGNAGIFGYDAYIGSMSISPGSGVEKITKSTSPAGTSFSSARVDWITGGRIQWFTPVKGLKPVVSFLKVDMTQGLEAGPVKVSFSTPDMTFLMFSIEYAFRNLTFAAEHNRTTMKATISMDMSALGLPDPVPVFQRTDAESYYGMITYRFSKWFEAGVYYSVHYSDKDDHDGDNMVAVGKNDYEAWQKDLAISTLFNINEYWIVKMEVHFINGVALAYGVDNPDGYDHEDSVLYAIKTTFNF